MAPSPGVLLRWACWLMLTGALDFRQPSKSQLPRLPHRRPPHCIGRRLRRHLTLQLDALLAADGHDLPLTLQSIVWCLPPVVPRFPCRQPRRLLERQRRGVSGSPMHAGACRGHPRGCRLGEAYPGPTAFFSSVGGATTLKVTQPFYGNSRYWPHPYLLLCA